LLKLTERLN